MNPPKSKTANRLSGSYRSLTQVALEFIRALGERRTYSVLKNWYCVFGILWGMPVPFVTIGIDLYLSHLAVTPSNIMYVITSHYFQYFFIMHPVFFGIVFGAMGTVRYNKQQKIEEFEKYLISNNAALEDANRKLQELDRLKSNFLSMVSHELRTPITTIQGYTTFLLTEKAGPVNGTQKECLKISEDAADFLNNMIGELLDLSRVENGEFKINLEKVKMPEIVDKALASLKIEADGKGILLEKNLPGDLPEITADGKRLLQVIINLFENGIKFNKSGGRVWITSSGPTDGKVTFCVSDTGIGIQRDELDKIFDKFYQVDSSQKRKYGGCGLGLAITKSIVELHGGKIWAESAIGSGSKFYFQLPLPAAR